MQCCLLDQIIQGLALGSHGHEIADYSRGVTDDGDAPYCVDVGPRLQGDDHHQHLPIGLEVRQANLAGDQPLVVARPCDSQIFLGWFVALVIFQVVS